MTSWLLVTQIQGVGGDSVQMKIANDGSQLNSIKIKSIINFLIILFGRRFNHLIFIDKLSNGKPAAFKIIYLFCK